MKSEKKVLTVIRYQKAVFFLIWFSVSCISVFLSGCTSSSDLQWEEEEHYRWAELSGGYFGEPGFKQLSSSGTNVDFVNRITEEEIDRNQHYLNGSGVAAGDVDGDGLIDLYFAGLNGSNHLYRNLGGMKFEDITAEAGVAHEDYYSTGAVFADIDGDTHLDLLITSMHKNNALYMNDGNGNFSLNENSGLDRAKGSTTMTLADIDADGDLDLYIANYNEYTVKDLYTTEELAWENILNEPYNQRQQTGPYTLVPPFDQHYEILMSPDNKLAGVAETGEIDELYINQGGTFEKVEDTREVFLDEEGGPFGLQRDWGLTAKFQDLTGNGLPDLYVCNDFFTKDRIWINQGKGVFKAIEWQAMRNLSFASMGVDFSDINRDGELDIFTTEMLSPEHSQRLRSVSLGDPSPIQIGEINSRSMYNRNSLFLKREDSTYAEVSYLSGVEATGWSWDATFMDINLNGYEDIIISTGYLKNVLEIDAQLEMMRKGKNMDEHFVELMSHSPPLKLPNKILMNKGDLSFKDKSSEWGLNISDISHGMAVADLNNDGSLDLIFNRMNQEAAIYQNTTNAPRIAVRLKGKSPNTKAVGAKIELHGGPVSQQKEISAGGDYLSGSDYMAMFAADADNFNHQLIITWPDGKQSRIDSVAADRIYEIDESENHPRKQNTTEKIKPSVEALFEDVSERIAHRHHEDSFNDWELQPLLPLRLSQLGPGVSWIDIDQDGDDDLFIASGKGGTTGAFENMGDGSFRPIDKAPFDQKVPGDQTAIIEWGRGKETTLLVGSANYEQGKPQAPSVYQYHSQRLDPIKSTLPNYSTTGPIAASDYDGDGDLDLFVGGRFVPAHYPRNASSGLFKNKKGNIVRDGINSRILKEIGLITSAVFTDYDGDGDPDLLLSREWDSIILLQNNNGEFKDVSERVGLTDYKGIWNGITTGDFNNDGRPDFVVTNQGMNSSYQLRQDQPLRIYYDDFNRDGRVDIIETYANEDGKYVPRHSLDKYKQLPVITNLMRSYEQFASAILDDIFGTMLEGIPFKEINILKHLLFLNTNTGFEALPLPIEAQFSAAFFAGVADFDNDGNEDVFLSQNFFALPEQVPRLDAGRGLILTGSGSGEFTPLTGTESGIKIYGEQRGASIGDFNQDGKADLAISQNGAETKLYANQVKRKGLIIRLHGPESNTNGIGSSLRLLYKDGSKGPRREIQAGSGYLSQNSATQILGTAEEKEPDLIEINWFNGIRQTVKYSVDKHMYNVFYHEKDLDN